MIHFILTREHAYTIEHYLQTWGRDMRGRIAPPVRCEQLRLGAHLSPGTYVFCDQERLDAAGLELAAAVWRQLAARPAAFKLFNDPSRLLRRYDLLRGLHAAGLNRFNVHRVGETGSARFPVFLRRASDHNGAISPLLHDAAALEPAVSGAIAAGAPAEDLLAVEYLDVVDAAGVYRKYSCFRVGDRVLPRHLFADRKWMIKHFGVAEEPFIEEELAFLKNDPHAEQIRAVFDLAHVDYGRIDYSVIDGRVQTWEINSNPTILVAPGRVAIGRLQAQGIFSAAFAEALAAIDHAPAGERAMRIEVPSNLARRLGVRAWIAHCGRWRGRCGWLGNRGFVKRLT